MKNFRSVSACCKSVGRKLAANKMMTTLLFFSLLLLGQDPARSLSEVNGQIRSMNGSPAPLVRVTLMPVGSGGNPTGANFASVDTDREGHYRVPNLPQGRYLITGGFFDAPTYFPGVQTIAEAQILSVEPGQNLVGIDFKLARPTSIALMEGRVMVDDGTPLPTLRNLPFIGIQAAAWNTSGVTATASVVADGTFTLSFGLPGRYTISPARLPLGYYLKSITYGSVDVTRSPITVATESTSTQLQILLTKTPPAGEQAGLKVSGRVLGMENVPAGAALRLSLQMNTTVNKQALLRLGEVLVNGDGTFEIDGVPAGEYRIQDSPTTQLGSVRIADRDLTGLEIRLTRPTSSFRPAILLNSTTPQSSDLPTQWIVPPPPITPPPPGRAALYLSQSGQSTAHRHGAISFFRVERTGVTVEELRLDGSPAISLSPGRYELRTWVRACGGTCSQIEAPSDECAAAFSVNAGDVILAERVVQGATCTIQFRRR
jgi:hypothetical protein